MSKTYGGLCVPFFLNFIYIHICKNTFFYQTNQQDLEQHQLSSKLPVRRDITGKLPVRRVISGKLLVSTPAN